MNTEKVVTAVGFTLMLAVVVVAVCCILTARHADKAVRKEAVREGVARWVPDDDGRATFEWVKPAGYGAAENEAIEGAKQP